MPPCAWLFDVDGVICHPEQKRITEPGIITEIINRLQNKEPVALVTGRSVEFMRKKVITLLKEELSDQALLQNFLAVGEKGGVMLTFDQNGTESQKIDATITVPQTMQDEARLLVNQKYSKAVFFDETKRTMISIEMHDGFNLDEFKKVQPQLDKDLEDLIKSYDSQNDLSLDSSTIATDIQNKHVGKHFAARYVLDWLTQRGISPQQFITFGDSSSDLAMAEEIHKKGLSVTFVFVGEPLKINPQDYPFPVVITKNRFELGTLEYLQQSKS